jgi:hypothetical protein
VGPLILLRALWCVGALSIQPDYCAKAQIGLDSTDCWGDHLRSPMPEFGVPTRFSLAYNNYLQRHYENPRGLGISLKKMVGASGFVPPASRSHKSLSWRHLLVFWPLSDGQVGTRRHRMLARTLAIVKQLDPQASSGKGWTTSFVYFMFTAL